MPDLFTRWLKGAPHLEVDDTGTFRSWSKGAPVLQITSFLFPITSGASPMPLEILGAAQSAAGAHLPLEAIAAAHRNEASLPFEILAAARSASGAEHPLEILAGATPGASGLPLEVLSSPRGTEAVLPIEWSLVGSGPIASGRQGAPFEILAEIRSGLARFRLEALGTAASGRGLAAPIESLLDAMGSRGALPMEILRTVDQGDAAFPFENLSLQAPVHSAMAPMLLEVLHGITSGHEPVQIEAEGDDPFTLELDWTELQIFSQAFLLRWDETSIALTAALDLTWDEIERLGALDLVWLELPAAFGGALSQVQKPYSNAERT